MITKTRILLVILIALALASPRLRADVTGHAADDELALAAAQLAAQATPGAASASSTTAVIVERNMGSFSKDHMRASSSLIRWW